MKTIRALTVPTFIVLALALPLSHVHSQVTGKTFRVTVKSSFGTTFTDCYRFDVPVAGSLTIDGLLQVITYRHGQLDTVDTSFKAVSRFGQPSIMFYGEEIEALEQLTGEAVNDGGATFVFSGPEAGPSTSPSLCVPAGPASGAITSGAPTGATPYEFR